MLSLTTKGKLAVLGLIFTVTKTYTLSLSATSILLITGPGTPIALILKGEEAPPFN
jgi:hypothetical protein